MGRMARRLVVVAGACGLVLAGASPALAGTFDWPFGGSGGAPWSNESRHTLDLDTEAFCREGARICANGGVNSGNLKNSQNVKIEGTANNSGSPSNVVSSSNSDNTVEGPADNSRNNVQDIGGGRHR